jgi:predicted nucleic acid-binding protein
MNGIIAIPGTLILPGIIGPDMDKPRFILDSNILIDTLNSKLDLFAIVAALSPCDIYINLVTEIETLAKPDMTAEEETEARLLLDSFLWAEIDAPTRAETIRIRREKTLRLPDALIAASAIRLNATVLSNDPHLQNYKRPGYTARSSIDS